MSLRKKDTKKCDTYNLQSLRTAFASKKHFFHLEIKQSLTIITANHTVKHNTFACFKVFNSQSKCLQCI